MKEKMTDWEIIKHRVIGNPVTTILGGCAGICLALAAINPKASVIAGVCIAILHALSLDAKDE